MCCQYINMGAAGNLLMECCIYWGKLSIGLCKCLVYINEASSGSSHPMAAYAAFQFFSSWLKKYHWRKICSFQQIQLFSLLVYSWRKICNFQIWIFSYSSLLLCVAEDAFHIAALQPMWYVKFSSKLSSPPLIAECQDGCSSDIKYSWVFDLG